VNRLPEKALEDIRSLASRGLGVRAIARATGIDKATVGKYIKKEAMAIGACECGAPGNHPAWCRFRYAKSMARQAYQASRRGMHIPLPPAVRMRRLSSVTKTKLRWLGRLPDAHSNQPPHPVEVYGIIGECIRETDFIRSAFREDICSELTVGALAGYIKRDEIARAARFFLKRTWDEHIRTLTRDFSHDSETVEQLSMEAFCATLHEDYYDIDDYIEETRPRDQWATAPSFFHQPRAE
jgi:hypothetical protein